MGSMISAVSRLYIELRKARISAGWMASTSTEVVRSGIWRAGMPIRGSPMRAAESNNSAAASVLTTNATSAWGTTRCSRAAA